MSNLVELPALATRNGFAVNVADPDYFGEVRVTAIGDAGTIRMLFGRDQKLISAYHDDTRRRTYRTTRIGTVKDWLGAA